MKKRKKFFVLAVLLWAAFVVSYYVAHAAPVSWDGNVGTSIVQPLQAFWGSLVKADHFQATSTSNVNIFPVANITRLSNLTSNGFVKTSGGNGTLGIDTSTYLTAALTSIGPTGQTTTGPAVIIASSTTGTDFTITGSGTTVTFNLPVASASNTGKLSSTDWSSFNGKQAAGNYVTALTGDVAASGPGSVAATLATVNGNVGSFTCTNLTVNGKGLITAAASGGCLTSAVTSIGPIGALQTGPAVTLASSTAGTDFTITASTNIITFNLPTASASNRGLLSSADWTTFNNKGSGTVTAVSVASANGFAGSSSGGATPALTLTTTITGLLKGNGTTISAASAGTDFVAGGTGANTQVTYFTGSGTIAGDTGMTYVAGTDVLTVVNASTTAFSSAYASSTLGYFGTLNLPNVSGTQCLHSISGVVSGTGSDCGASASKPGTIATSTLETAGYVPFATSNSAYPALLGFDSNFNWDNTNKTLGLGGLADTMYRLSILSSGNAISQSKTSGAANITSHTFFNSANSTYGALGLEGTSPGSLFTGDKVSSLSFGGSGAVQLAPNNAVLLTADTSGVVGIASTTPYRGVLTVESGTASTTNTFLTGNVNSFLELVVKNRSNGASASGDLVVEADNGSVTTHYIDMGINGSGGAANPFTTANHAYLYSVGDTLNIGALGSASELRFFTGGGIAAPNQRMTIDINGNVGIASSTPWALLAVASSTWGTIPADYNRPLFAVATSSSSFGQLLAVFATTTANTSGNGGSIIDTGVRIVVGSFYNTLGAIQNLYNQLFINGRYASSWENSFCDSPPQTMSIVSDQDYICGWMMYDESSNSFLGAQTSLDGFTQLFVLGINSAATNDASALRLGSPLNPNQLASTTPVMEVRVTSMSEATAVSSTTRAFMGWMPSLSGAPGTNACLVIATSTANWQAVCNDNVATTLVDTGIATSTSAKFRLELSNSRFTVYAKNSIYVGMTRVANITTNIPTNTGITLFPYVASGRTTNGLAIAYSWRIATIRYWQQLPWEWNQ